ncbi:MAG: hypothetical protein JNN13_06260 [Planctomycetes bacterium]|nr:hypothetical protein [Planctomycetota bacterium]
MTRVPVAWLGAVLPWLLVACGQATRPFVAPQAALYDERGDCYLVSDGSGAPVAKPGHGRILRVDAETGALADWLVGGEHGVTLRAPKGMAFAGDVLWVADVDVLRKFDRATAASLGEVVIPAANCLTDVSAAADGTIYCSDSGLDRELGATGSDAIWRVSPAGVVEVLRRGPELGQPTGLVARDSGVFVVSWRDGVLYQVDRRGVRTDLGKAPTPQLTGLVRGEGDAASGPAAWYVSSWAGACVYHFDVSGAFTALPKRFDQPGDLGFDPKRRRLLLPLHGQRELLLLPM